MPLSRRLLAEGLGTAFLLAVVVGTAIEAFRHAHALVPNRVTALLKLPLETMSRDELKQALDHIGTITNDDEEYA